MPFPTSRSATLFFSLLPLLAAHRAVADDWLPQAQRMNREIVRKEDRQARQRQIFKGFLSQGESKPQQLTLRSGKYYTFFADCDRNCTDIDLALLHDGRVITSNTDPHDSPMFGWYGRQGGRYTLTITMPRCSVDKCAYSIQIFEGRNKIL